jgi:hypothetical protein
MTEEELALCWKLIEQRAEFVYHGPRPAPIPDATTSLCKIMVEERKRMKEENSLLKSALVGQQEQLDILKEWRKKAVEERRQMQEEILFLKATANRLREEIDELGEWRKTVGNGGGRVT